MPFGAEAIDLATLAWFVGKLWIRVGGLSGAEGRIVTTAANGGVIRVATDDSLGRLRFTIACELGHFVLHQNSIIDRTVETKHFTVWNEATEEAEANCFCSRVTDAGVPVQTPLQRNTKYWLAG